MENKNTAEVSFGEPQVQHKPRLAIWEYKNSNEEVSRLMVLSMDYFHKEIKEGRMTKEEYERYFAFIDDAYRYLFDHYNVMPKLEKNDNTKPENWDEIQASTTAIVPLGTD